MRLYRQLQPRDPILENGDDRRVFEEILRTSHLHIFLLTENTDVLSTTYLNVIPNITRGASPYAIIENVVTDEGHRGLGLGKALMSHTLSYAWRQGCYKAMLQTGSKRESTHAFYRSCGFDGSDKRGYVARPGQ